MVPRASHFFSELRRRKVYRAAGVYVAVGLGVLGAAELILDPLGLSGARSYIVVLVLLGFPIALVLAWIYEVRPEASPGPDEAEGGPADTGPPPVSGGRTSGEARSIAVLPFDSLSADPEGDYFADGIAEELINTLARQEGLRVVARTSAFAFKGQAADVREIGRRLNVSHVIEGSVRRTDQALRITAQLISTDDGYHVWSEQFDRGHGDIFRIQEEISRCVLQKLQQGFCDGEGPAVPTTELSAYDAYLRGRHALARFNPSTLQGAVEHFETAIARDDHFAPALASLAEALTMQSIGFSDRLAEEIMPRAEEAANRALELNGHLPEAHLARALVRMYRHWDYAGAKKGFDRALELNPNFAEAHLWQEFYWTYVQHDFEKALDATRRARRLSPLDMRIRDREATVHYVFGELEEAEGICREILAQDPSNPLTHLSLADTLVRMGRTDESVVHMEEAVRLGGRAHAFLGMLAAFYGVQGNQPAARAVVEELEARQRVGYLPGFWTAVAYSGVGRMDDAFANLERAIEERDGNLLYLSVAPRASGFHDDPRFPSILERIGLGHLVPLL
jgi:serine/threonine-protein kinase